MYSTFTTRHSVWQGLWDQILSFQTALTNVTVRVETMQEEIKGPPSDAGSLPPRHLRIATHHPSDLSSSSSGSPLAFPVAPLALSQGEYENSDSNSSAASAATAERRQPRPLTREPAHSDIFHPTHVSGLYGSGSGSSSPLPPRHRRPLAREGALVLSAGSSSGQYRSRARFANSASSPFSSLRPPLLPVSGSASASASGSASGSAGSGSGSGSTGSRKRARDAGSGSDSGNSDADAQEGRRVRQRGASYTGSASPADHPNSSPTPVRTLKRTREDDGADDGARKRARTFMEVVLGPTPRAHGAVSAALLPSPPSRSAPSPPSLSAPPRAPSPSAARSSSPATSQPRPNSAGGTPRRRSARLMAQK
ncbi:hypothetical protein HWV62_20270 [Athelia sp. TMB]|nr:hypothetical protein HWV62_20270 [Athelia sp. TMB]